jgi:beta-lactam-binding protein with PASTA domain/tRNA A-37 threonylcarbamoyl transferase component Bud32
MEPTMTPRVLSGRYELAHLVARGGMAEVYRAHDRFLDRPVALKILFPELSVDQAFVQRFRREAQAAANLAHPNIVSVYDWGEDGSTYFIVMEFIEGRPLSAILRSGGPMHPDRATEIAADVAAALAYAHRHDVVHRDVKPGNVLITDEGLVKVTDFGIARALNTEESLTQTGAVMGTATYFSPEQAEGLGVDRRSDIYSLGVVLFEMVTGRPPFVADSPVAVASKHVREQPPLPRELNPAVPEGLEAIILKCLAKSPEHRYATAEELRNDLVRFRDGRAVLAAGIPPTALVTALVPQGTPSATQALPHAPGTQALPAERSRTPMYLAVLVVLLAALGVVVAFLGNSLGWWHLGGTTSDFSMPNVVSEPLSEAQAKLRADGLSVRVVDVTSPSPAGTVVRTKPPAGASVHKGSTVTLYVSSGTPSPQPTSQVTLPDVTSLDLATAEARLEALGMKVDAVAVSSSAPMGQVVAESPPPGTAVAPGTTVTLDYSNGSGSTGSSSTVEVPNVAGDDVTTASNALGQAGLCVNGETRQSSNEIAAGYVIGTNPPAGTSVARGSCVELVVSSGPSEVTVRNVVGDTQSQATSILEDQGFVVAVQYQTISGADCNEEGVVLAQSPQGGTTAPPGSTVTITVGQSGLCGTTTTTTTTPGGGQGSGQSPSARPAPPRGQQAAGT